MATVEPAETDLEEPFSLFSFMFFVVDAAENRHQMVLPHYQDTFLAFVRGSEPDTLI